MDLFGIKKNRELCRRREELRKREALGIKFNRAFGFILPRSDASFLQPAVDRFLQETAIAFKKACEIQEEVNCLPPDQQGSLHEFLVKITAAKRTVENKKEIFWGAHEVAKLAGFSVKEKHTDYLK
jgi:hypothetical protein